MTTFLHEITGYADTTDREPLVLCPRATSPHRALRLTSNSPWFCPWCGYTLPPEHDCGDNAVYVLTDGPLGHAWECGICHTLLQVG